MINMIFVLVVISVALWLVNTLIPMDAKIKMVINVVAILLIIWWVLHWFGLVSAPPGR